MITDCYNCERSQMMRVNDGVNCPDGWISAPVFNGISEDPCKVKSVNKFERQQYRGLQSTDITSRYGNMSGTDSGFNMQHKVFGLTMLLGGLFIGVTYHSQIKKLLSKSVLNKLKIK
jgi:hypothetical protein